MKLIKKNWRVTTCLSAAVLAGCGATVEGEHLDTANVEQPIIGGSVANAGEFPWQAQLRNNNNHSCGGSLIHTEWVLTAAHCVENSNINNLSLRFGLNTLNAPEPGTVVRNIDEVIIHPQRNAATHEWDAALLHLDAPVTPTPTIRPIAFTTVPTLPDENAVVSGWGRFDQNSWASSNVLKKASLPVRSDKVCLDNGMPFGDGMLCMSDIGSPDSVCHGDSGGPLVVYRQGTPLLVGAVSWGWPSCSNNSAFADVYEVHKWIEGHIAPGPIEGDINGNGCVDLQDYTLFSAYWGSPVTPASAAADINGDGSIDAADYTLLISNWGAGC